VPWIWFVVRDLGGPADVIAIVLPLVAITVLVAAVVLAAVTHRSWALAAGFSTLVMCAVVVAGPAWPRAIDAPHRPIDLVVANVWDANTRLEDVPASMLDRDVDLAIAVEMPDAGLRPMTDVAGSLGLEDFVHERTLGAWSRFPIHELDDRGLPRARVLRVGVEAPGAPFVLYVVHALNPLRSESFDDQRVFTERLLGSIADEQMPVVVAGDLNMSDRVVSYRVMDAALTDAMRAETAGSATYVSGWWPMLMLRIDHVFVDQTWCASDPFTFGVPGSDHRGLHVSIGPCD
jgi:endonuclease/exonuclease/phosphatase (EEP) superfamily protein YafD